MDPETFRNLAQGVQALSISVAAIAGGIWAIFKLYSSKELDKSRIEALKSEKEFNIKKGISGCLEITKGAVLPNGATPIFLQATINNESSETHTLDWNLIPMQIASLKNIDDKMYNFALVPETKLVHTIINCEGSDKYCTITTTTTILPNSSKTLDFYWECQKEGVYLATISAILPESIVNYYHTSDEDGILEKARDRNEKNDPKYLHQFQFSINKYFQVSMPNK